MKIYKIVLVGAIALSMYLGYSNFLAVDLSVITEVFAPMSMEDTEEMVKDRVRGKGGTQQSEQEPDDYTDLAMKIGETLSPLIAAYFASRKRKSKSGEIKTLDDDIGDIAVHLGVSKAFVRGKLGLGDRRKKQNGTNPKRRVNDKKS